MRKALNRPIWDADRLCSASKNTYYSVGMNLSRSRLYYCIRNLGGEPVHSGEIRLLGKTRGSALKPDGTCRPGLLRDCRY